MSPGRREKAEGEETVTLGAEWVAQAGFGLGGAETSLQESWGGIHRQPPGKGVL